MSRTRYPTRRTPERRPPARTAGRTAVVPPKHEVLYRTLLEQVRDSLAPGDPLPSERELTSRYGVSRATVRTALQRLHEEGRVRRLRGAGTFAARPATVSKSLALTSFTEDMRARRLAPGSRTLGLRRIAANAAVALDLRLSPGADVVYLRRLRLADGEPMCLEEVWLPGDLLPDPDPVARGSLYAAFARHGVRLDAAEQVIGATVVDESQARLLAVPAYSPAIRVTRVTFDEDDRPVERAESVYRADRYDFRVTVTRGPGAPPVPESPEQPVERPAQQPAQQPAGASAGRAAGRPAR